MRRLLAALLFLSIPLVAFLFFFDVDWTTPASQPAPAKIAPTGVSLTALEGWLASDNPKARSRAFTRVQELAAHGDSDEFTAAVQLLLEHIPKEKSEELRSQFLTRLLRLPQGRIPDRRYLDLFERLLDDESLRVRLTAARELAGRGEALERVFHLAAGAVLEAGEEDAALALAVLGRAGLQERRLEPRARPLIKGCFTHASPHVRAEAMRSLLHLERSTEAISACTPFLSDESPRVRNDAILMLKTEAARHPEVRRALLQCLGDTDRYVQAEAIRAVAGWQPCDDELRQAFLAALKTRHPFARGIAVQVAPSLKDPAIDAVVFDMQTDADWFCRWKLVHALRDLGIPERDKRAALAKLSNDADLTVRQSAQNAIKNNWHKGRPGS